LPTLRVTPGPSARATRAALIPLPKSFEPLDPLLGPDRFDRSEGGHHADSNSLIRSLWEAPIGLFGAQRQKNGQQEQFPAGVSG
jgi:hypothetical protein